MLFEKIGLLDERFFAYWEDTDFSLRAFRHEFKNIVCKDAVVYHKHHKSWDELYQKNTYYYYYMYRNKILLIKKHSKNKLLKVNAYRFILAELIGDLINCAKLGNTNVPEYCLTGFGMGLLINFGPMDKEKKLPKFIHKIAKILMMIKPGYLKKALSYNFKKNCFL